MWNTYEMACGLKNTRNIPYVSFISVTHFLPLVETGNLVTGSFHP